MRISDWSSDVCSSDLETEGTRTVLLLEDTQEITNVPGVYIVPLPYRDAEERDTLLDQALAEVLRTATRTLCVGEVRGLPAARMMFQGAPTGVQVLTTLHALSAIGSVARDRTSVVEGTSVAVPGEVGGRRRIKKKKNENV